ncbi:hypothetical protein SCUCBS95973_007290 [Sporothrix curviconia]|uniref:Uncharacterized protein n=1 Tax=Sporothrix curviconia TaxID=1260050 RepID=A0ABP0CDZ9_9PEZI
MNFETFDAAMKTICNGDTHGWGAPEVAHRRSGIRIQTGQLYTIRANAPEQLPSMELLQLQWDLLRIAAMSGAADVYDDNGDDSDDQCEDDELCSAFGSDEADTISSIDIDFGRDEDEDETDAQLKSLERPRVIEAIDPTFNTIAV